MNVENVKLAASLRYDLVSVKLATFQARFSNTHKVDGKYNTILLDEAEVKAAVDKINECSASGLFSWVIHRKRMTEKLGYTKDALRSIQRAKKAAGRSLETPDITSEPDYRAQKYSQQLTC